MLKNDQIPGTGGGEGDVLLNDPTATAITEEELAEHEGEDSDPLDAIADETVRANAKKDRAIGRRIAKAKATPKVKVPVVSSKEDDEEEDDDEEDTPALPANAATKDDLKRIATNGAKKLVPEEVMEVWDELAGVPLGGFDAMDPDSIALNYIKRYNVYRMEHPVDSENPATPLTVSVVPKSGGSKKVVANQEGERKIPGLIEPVPPEDWYK